ncbi:mucin-17-like [Culex pipiens pallens]|uniref:mucin-17-like n=1 Tax=Culex pipiens pallens TaxID=42434 RepID=UPI0022AB47B8|nr:mucin-17-like [Culex pipiens pallens]
MCPEFAVIRTVTAKLDGRTMSSSVHLRSLGVILWCAFVCNFCDCSTFRLGKSNLSNLETSIFKNSRDPSNAFHSVKKPAYSLQNVINTSNLVSLPQPTLNGLSALFPNPSSTESTPYEDSTSTISPSAESSASGLPDGPSENVPGEANLNPPRFPSLIELIALQPDINAVRPVVTYSPIFTTPTTVTSTASTTTTPSSTSTMPVSSTDASTASETPSPPTESSPTTATPSSSTDSSTPAVSDTTSTTPLSSTDASTVSDTPSPPTEATSPAVSDPTPTTETPSSSTDSSSPAVSDPTSTTPVSSTDASTVSDTPSPPTEATSPAVSDPTSTTPVSSTDASTASDTPSPPTDATSPAVSDPTPTTAGPSSSTDSSSPVVSDPTSTTPSAVSDPTPTTQGPSSSPAPSDTPSPPTDSTPSSSTDSTTASPVAPAAIVGQIPHVFQLFPGFNPPPSGSALLPTIGGNPAPANDSPLDQIQGAAAQLIASSNIPSIFNSTAGGLSAIASLPNVNGINIPTPVANDSPIEQIQTTAAQLLASGSFPYVFNTTTGGLNAITSIPSNAGINLPQLPTLGDTPVANDNPISQLQTTASELLASSNVPSIFNSTTAGINSIVSNAGIQIPQVPTFSDVYVANDTPLNEIQTAASQLLTSSNIPNIFNGTTGLNAITSLPNITGISIPAIPTLGDAPVASDTPVSQLQTAASQLVVNSNPSSIFNKTAGGLNAHSFPYAYGGYFLGNAPITNDSPFVQIQSAASEAVNVFNSTVNNNNPINQAQNAASQLLASSNIPSIFNTTANGLNNFAIPSFNIPQIPTFGDVPVGNDGPFTTGLQNTAGNPPVYRPLPDLSNFQSQLAVLVSQLNNETAPFPNNPNVQLDDILTKPQTNPVNSAQLQPSPPVTEKHPLLTIFPQQVQSDSYFGIPSFSLPNNTFGQFINQLAGLASNFTGGASNATNTNTTESTNSGTNPLQSIGNQISSGFSNVAEVISNGTAAIGNLGAQIANQTASSNGTSANNANGTVVPDANQLGGALSQIISNGTSIITAPINSIFQTNFSRAYNPALNNLYNQLSSVGSNETVTQVTNALSPAVLAGQLSGILSQLQASNPLASNDVAPSQQQEANSNGILNWNAINKLPIISNWIGTNSNNKPVSIARPTLSCPVCQEVCGKVNSPVKLRQQRVVGGTVVDPANKYPWTTRFVYFNSNAGQGSLINDRAVVTTATTVIGMPLYSQATALFNVYDTLSTTEQRFSKNLARVIPHPKFNTNNPLNNNIGIVILDSPVAMSTFIQPICLPTTFDSYAGTQAVVAGWGADSIGGHSSPVPHEVSIPIYSSAECKLANDNLTTNNLCGGVVQPAQSGSVKSTCEGDDGAGLMAPSRVDPSLLTLIGITIETAGEGCGNNNQPAAFTNVQNYIDFVLYNGIGCGC